MILLQWNSFSNKIPYDYFISLELLCIYRMLFTLQSGYHTFRETLGIWERRRTFSGIYQSYSLQGQDSMKCKICGGWKCVFRKIGQVYIQMEYVDIMFVKIV